MAGRVTHTAALSAIGVGLEPTATGELTHTTSLAAAREASAEKATAQAALHTGLRLRLTSLRTQVTTSQDVAQKKMESLWADTKTAVDEGAAAVTTMLSEQARHLQGVKKAQARAREALLRETMSEVESILHSKLDGLLASSLDTAVASQMEKSASIRGGVEATRAAVTSFRGEAGVAQATWVEAVGATTAAVENIDVATASTMESAVEAQQAMEGVFAGLEGESAAWSDRNAATAAAVAAAVAETDASGALSQASQAEIAADAAAVVMGVCEWEHTARDGHDALAASLRETSEARQALSQLLPGPALRPPLSPHHPPSPRFPPRRGGWGALEGICCSSCRGRRRGRSGRGAWGALEGMGRAGPALRPPLSPHHPPSPRFPPPHKPHHPRPPGPHGGRLEIVNGAVSMARPSVPLPRATGAQRACARI